MLKSYQVAFVLALLVPLAHVGSADARPTTSSHSFKSGFSSHRSSSSSSMKPSYSSAKSGGFGSFSRHASSAAPAPAPVQPSNAGRPSGGFGSFGGGAAAPQKSDSALSQKLNRNASEANALRTLDARRQAQEQAQTQAGRDTRPVPGYEHGGNAQPAPPPQYGQAQQQAPIIVRQDSGLGHVIAGAVLANMARGAHANNNGYPGAYPSTPGGGTMAPAPARSGGTSFLGVFMTLCVLALVGWAVYFAWRRVRRSRAAKKPNYSFERN
ncbi:hypothetical protein [Massilia sp. Root335]|uniref:hypothetical protein n=1 Tax=Massilia sp. Root335 TaxID=1736517 RepID=UPI000714479F|nr:hypothetical protein [Massilia sp. Root335]KQV27021.1 hypothetical protein ASC93_28995 [Massilia sp. Root335]